MILTVPTLLLEKTGIRKVLEFQSRHEWQSSDAWVSSFLDSEVRHAMKTIVSWQNEIWISGFPAPNPLPSESDLGRDLVGWERPRSSWVWRSDSDRSWSDDNNNQQQRQRSGSSVYVRPFYRRPGTWYYSLLAHTHTSYVSGRVRDLLPNNLEGGFPWCFDYIVSNKMMTMLDQSNHSTRRKSISSRNARTFVRANQCKRFLFDTDCISRLWKTFPENHCWMLWPCSAIS